MESENGDAASEGLLDEPKLAINLGGGQKGIGGALGSNLLA
jgi:hypothetical protein